MDELRVFLCWVATTLFAALMVGSQLEALILMSGEVAGLLAGLFLSLCLGSVLLLAVPVVCRFILAVVRDAGVFASIMHCKAGPSGSARLGHSPRFCRSRILFLTERSSIHG